MSNSALITDVEEESDIDLIAGVALLADDKDTALAAFEALHARYASWCLGVARFQDYNGIDPDMVVSKTFASVWCAAGNFDPEKRGEGVSRENAVKAWIYRILKNEIISEIRKRATRNEISIWDGFGDADEKQNEAFDAIGDERFAAPATQNCSQEDEALQKPIPSQMALLKELMISLSEKERMILDLSAPYIDPRPPFKCHIPKDHLGHLAAQIGVAPASIKVLRQRVYEKLRKLAESHPPTPHQLTSI